MRSIYPKRLGLFSITLIAFTLVLGSSLVYGQSSSDNYQLEEAYFGTGGELDLNSDNYSAQAQTGSLGVGNSSSANFDLAAGGVTQNAEFLEVQVVGADVNFGTLSPTAASYAASQGGACNCSFYVRSYISSGYTVVSASQPPTNENGDVISEKSVLGAINNNQDIEEFGINLVANTTPSAFGANPANQPDDSFADGQAAAGYDTPDQFQYGAGDAIAESQATPGNPAIGRTDYTISYLLKISNNTPAGFYVLEHDLIVVPVF